MESAPMAHADPTPLETIPAHLRVYLSKQDYELYTPIDHAAWRFIMRIGRSFYATHAHPKYLDGLHETGISTERIPRIDEMDTGLRRFGWRALPVIGFIPPAAFLEFQSHGLLPIACDMRKAEHLEYTPAPDIVHEAAGHAPIIADPDYATYLRSYGEVSRRAIFSKANMSVYGAVRRLSDTKERPDATRAEIDEAQRELERRLAEVTYDSEVDWVTRLGWWTTEYGLIGGLDDFLIYGAGLLSSIGESYNCFSPAVRKIPLSTDCIHQAFNITEPQPQLFVTPTFPYLNDVLEDLASRMAFRIGGVHGLEAARRGETTATVQLDSGLQISGTLIEFRVDAAGSPCFLRFTGPVQLARDDTQIPGQDPQYHASGYSTPIGPLRGRRGGVAELTDADLESRGFLASRKGRLEFASGIVIEGRLVSKVRGGGKNQILSFTECSVHMGDEILFDPAWGTFDLGCGESVPTVFGGAADRYAYMVALGEDHYEPGTHKTNLTTGNSDLNRLYARVRAIREAGESPSRGEEFADIVCELDEKHPNDWLLRWELLELDHDLGFHAPWAARVRSRLAAIRTIRPAAAASIERGLALLI
jgi:phenylalanine-4-hydroxylase